MYNIRCIGTSIKPCEVLKSFANWAGDIWPLLDAVPKLPIKSCAVFGKLPVLDSLTIFCAKIV